MIFLDLTLENFGPYHGSHTLNLRPEAGRPIILIGGRAQRRRQNHPDGCHAPSFVRPTRPN